MHEFFLLVTNNQKPGRRARPVTKDSETDWFRITYRFAWHLESSFFKPLSRRAGRTEHASLASEHVFLSGCRLATALPVVNKSNETNHATTRWQNGVPGEMFAVHLVVVSGFGVYESNHNPVLLLLRAIAHRLDELLVC